MAKKQTETERQLVGARQLCLLLVTLASDDSEAAVLVLTKAQHGEAVADLLNQFARLDAKERRQKKAGKKGAEFGKLGGRPRKAASA